MALDAARQCGAARLPEIVAPLPLSEAIARHLVGRRPLLVAALVAGAPPLRDWLVSRRAAPVPDEAVLAIGPEGGWIDAELGSFERAGFRTIDLGPRILRTETALAALVGKLF